MTMMQVFNQFMSQGNGMGNLLGLSLGDMFEEEELDPIYKNIFKVMSGGEIIGLITQKNFSFFNTKRQEIKEALNKSI